MATCKHPDCLLPQQERSDGVGLGYCPEHRAARLRRAEPGTITPGPRGRGWRIKTTTGWEPCDAQGRPLRKGTSRTANPDRLTPAQHTVLRTLHRLVCASDRVIAGTAGLDKGTVSRRRDELARAGLVEIAVPRQGHEPAMWRCTSSGTVLARPAGWWALHPLHYCLTCSDGSAQGQGCHNCRGTGMDQTPCLTCTAAGWFDVPAEILGRFS